MYTAAARGPWSETKLFGWSSESPISTEGVAYDINTDPRIPEMHDCFIVGEPGALLREPDVLELSLSCPVISGGGATIEVRLLRSLDHGVSWSFVATLLSPEDGMALGSTVPEINGSALLYANGGYHLIVTPTSNVDFPDGPGPGYRGCVVVPFLDIETGTIERCNGTPSSKSRTRRARPVRGCASADGRFRQWHADSGSRLFESAGRRYRSRRWLAAALTTARRLGHSVARADASVAFTPRKRCAGKRSGGGALRGEAAEHGRGGGALEFCSSRQSTEAPDSTTC
jgi:hypothetical protein